MERMIRFRLNETLHELAVREESLALDWVRETAGLTGTKEGCREGDCGACLVLLGGRSPGGGTEWMSVTSCTLAMGELDGRHLVTIEGLASAGLTPVMEAMLDEGASQCGFCSPGFVLALTGFLVNGEPLDAASAMAAVEGNLCRCTGYGSIRRAAARLCADFADLPAGIPARLRALGERGVLPPSLAALMAEPPAPARTPSIHSGGNPELGGGTDYFVRNPDPEPGLSPGFSDLDPAGRSIAGTMRGGIPCLELEAAVTVSDFFGSPAVRKAAPGIERFESDIASPPIRNRATLAGNLANASPIADMTAMLLALGASLDLEGAGATRTIPLEEFFFSYKKTALAPGERIGRIVVPAGPVLFNFEKSAKRARLDIATVNTALAVTMAADGTVARARWSAGGIAPVPLRLPDLEALLIGRKPSAALAREAGSLAMASGAPIGDVRGSAGYRRRLMERLAWAHFIRLWPALKLDEELMP